MTIKNFALLYLTFVFLSVAHPGRSVPIPEDAVAQPTFEPPQDVLVMGQPDNVVSPAALSLPSAGTVAGEEVDEKLSHATVDVSSDSSSLPQSQDDEEKPEVLEGATPPTAQPVNSEPNTTDPISSASPPGKADEHIAPVFSSQEPGATGTFPTPSEALVSALQSTGIASATETPQVTLPLYTMPPIISASRTSYGGPRTSPGVPLPSQARSSESQVTNTTRRTIVIGTMVALSLLMSLIACIFCFRCQCCRRKKKSSENLPPLDLIGERTPRVDDKGKASPYASPKFGGFMLPILRSRPTPHVTFADPPEQQDWRVGKLEELSPIMTSESFIHINLDSLSDVHISEGPQPATAHPTTAANADTRASAGAVSTAGAPSLSTRASMYSDTSTEVSTLMRCTPSLDKLNQLATLATTTNNTNNTNKIDIDTNADIVISPTSSSPTRSRKRSKTETSASPPLLLTEPNPMKPTKSLPSITSYENRFSNDSARTTKDKTRSGDSEWDVARVYGGSRFSKESVGGGSILSTISEASGVEAVEVGGKQCVLVTGKF